MSETETDKPHAPWCIRSEHPSGACGCGADPNPLLNQADKLGDKTLEEWRAEKFSKTQEYWVWVIRCMELIDAIRTTRQENLRLLDLVRFVRHDLHSDGLITDEEYAALVSDKPGHAAVARLESYDGMRKRITELEQQLAESNRLNTGISDVYAERDSLKTALRDAEQQLANKAKCDCNEIASLTKQSQRDRERIAELENLIREAEPLQEGHPLVAPAVYSWRKRARAALAKEYMSRGQ